MTVKSQAYDHPAYLAVWPIPTGQLNGSAGAGTKYAAFANLLIKSVTIAATTLGTASNNIVLVRVTGTGGTNTTTSTTTIGTIGSGAYFSYMALATNSQVNLNQGDLFWIQNGADVTGTWVGQIETLVASESNLTA